MDNKKIYRVSVAITTEQTTYIEAASPEDAATKAELIYNGDSGLECEGGGSEISHNIEVEAAISPSEARAGYRGDPATIAAENAKAFLELECQYPSEDSNACITHNIEH